MSTIEIILPLRNPTAVLGPTVDSLAGQTDRAFSVLISDNHSTQGAELIAAAVSQLQAAGIATRLIRPPSALGRVEHWNWAHHQAAGDWLKPLFAGDWLELAYLARLRAGLTAHPECRYAFAPYVLHRTNLAPESVISPWAGRFFPPAEMAQKVLSLGMQFGPPSAAAYERTAFVIAGGYPTPLPICSDSLLFCGLASRFGVLGLADALCHFNIHDARFSTTLPQKRRDTFREIIIFYWMLAVHARAEQVAFSRIGFARLLARQTRGHLSGG